MDKMPFGINGYLGDEVKEIIEVNYKNHQQVFKICEEINKVCTAIEIQINYKCIR